MVVKSNSQSRSPNLHLGHQRSILSESSEPCSVDDFVTLYSNPIILISAPSRAYCLEKVRRDLSEWTPSKSVRISSSIGNRLFLAIIGLQSNQQIWLIRYGVQSFDSGSSPISVTHEQSPPKSMVLLLQSNTMEYKEAEEKEKERWRRSDDWVMRGQRKVPYDWVRGV